MEEEHKQRLERILTRGAKAAVRLAYESAIAVTEELGESKKQAYLSHGQWLAYHQALADVKAELVKLHSHFAE